MCGIYGYHGKKTAAPQLLDGLKRLDYRGYDSWGIAVLDKSISVYKDVGEVYTPKKLPKGTVGIGHTRWATHGAVSQVNAHPHAATDGSFVLAQNGIMENFETIKKNLEQDNYTFKSQTDTEAIVYLIESYRKKGYTEAIRRAYTIMTGRNTIILLTESGDIFAARNGSPLVIGKNEQTGEYFISSDMLSFAPYVTHAHTIGNGQLVALTENGFDVSDLATGKPIEFTFQPINVADSGRSKNGYDHYMLKEIHDTPDVIRAVVAHAADTQTCLQAVSRAQTVYTIGSGTAGIAAAQIAWYLRTYAKKHAVSLVGADAKEYIPLIGPHDIVIAPSQSGETADVLEVLEQLKAKKIPIITYVNMPGSMMSRIADYPLMAHTGSEICVMSTKVFTSQIAWGYLLAKMLSGQTDNGKKDLVKLSHAVDTYLQDQKAAAQIRSFAKKVASGHDIFLLGAYQNFQIVREGMVKIIEGTYKHAHAVPAGDLKHYAITLMEKGTKVLIVYSKDEVKDDILNAASQVAARGATVTGIGPTTHDVFDTVIQTPDTGETSAIMNVIPLQLLAYETAKLLGNNIDKPRNIAKSVTVK